MVKFKSAAEEFGVEQLLLPIYYIDVPQMEADQPSDKLMAFVSTIHRVDLRALRLKNETDADHRAMVNSLASRLLKIATETEAEPAEPPSPDGTHITAVPSVEVEDAAGEAGEQADTAGFLEVLAAGEEALPKWGETIEEFSKEMQAINEATEKTTAEMESDQRSGGASFASQLSIANKLARRLGEPAANLTDLAQEYAEQLITIDPAIQTLIRFARESDELRSDENTQDTFRSIQGMAETSRQSMGQIVELANVMEESAGVSRELRRPLRAIQTALRNVSDGQEVMDDWDRQIRDLLED